jgi:hypothetical protein
MECGSGTTCFELLKITVQFVATLGIGLCAARLTVLWALARYKSEKIWERRIGVYAELVESIGEMREVLGTWEDAEIRHQSISDERAIRLSDRYASARRRLEAATALAHLLLHPDVAESLEQVAADINRVEDVTTHPMEEWQAELAILKGAQSFIIEHGRTETRSVGKTQENEK